MKLKRKYQLKKKKLKLTRQTHDTVYESELTMYKANHNKLWNTISNKLNVEVWN